MDNVYGVVTLFTTLFYLVLTLLLFAVIVFVQVPVILYVAFAWWIVATIIVLLYPRGQIVEVCLFARINGSTRVITLLGIG